MKDGREPRAEESRRKRTPRSFSTQTDWEPLLLGGDSLRPTFPLKRPPLVSGSWTCPPGFLSFPSLALKCVSLTLDKLSEGDKYWFFVH